MGPRKFIIAAMGSALAVASVVAYAQSVPPEAASEVPSTASEPTAPPTTAPEPAFAPQVAEPPSDVEDAPVDVPTSPQTNWMPDINRDVQNDTANVPATAQRERKPRKVLSDAGENVLGTGGWSREPSSQAASNLLSRANRRERAVDPLKRSDLTKLSRVMGALHALRVSCSGRDDQTYRSRMATMLDLEAPDSGTLRDPLVDAFNGGFQAYGRGASACPADARVQEASLAKDGYVLARTMSVRYRPAPKEVAALPSVTQPRQDRVAAVAAPVVKPKGPAVPPATSPPSRASWNTATAN